LNTILKCILLDDELPGLTYLKMLCEQIPGIEVVKAFDNPETLLREVANIEFDFCILDIEMPQISGLQIANLLKGKPIIFATAYKEYAADAFDLDAVDYIRKPLTKERLASAVEKVVRHIQSHSVSKSYIQLNTDKGKAILFFNEIAYFHTSNVDSRDKIIVLHDGSSITAKNYTFRSLLDKLPLLDFCQVNKKEVIAINAITFFNHDEITTKVTLANGKPLMVTLSDNFRNEFKKKITT
jgi:DNA-binding LytR/AlgR family response regulator